MNYASIDPVLTAWAKKYNIQIFTRAQDWEIRSFSIKNIMYLLGTPENGRLEVEIFNDTSKSLIDKEYVKTERLEYYLEGLTMDIYGQINRFIEELKADGYAEFSEALRDAKFSGSMGGEILGLVSLELKKYPLIIKKEDEFLLSEAALLLKRIKTILN